MIFDHQICVDPEGETLYVFGGRTVNGDTNIQNYSGLYSYNIKLNQWKLVRNDDIKPNTTVAPTTAKNNSLLKSRVGHSMLFDSSQRALYVFAGQRVKDYLSDLYKYLVDEDIVQEITQDYSKDAAGPDTGFTQRATLDEELQEIYVLSGYMRNQNCDVVKNALWIYSIQKNQWQKIDKSFEKGEEGPCPRFAHQMVYDPIKKIQYLFGGNPGDQSDSTKRLNDFWQLKLTKPDPNAILRKCFYMIRIQKLKELCCKASTSQQEEEEDVIAILTALNYLRRQVALLVNHQDIQESREFHQMCANFCLLESNILSLDDAEQDDSFLKSIYGEENCKSEGKKS